VSFRLDKIAIVGVGLIGGSFALALKRAGAVGTVAGLGRTQASLARAVELGVIDAAHEEPRAALEGAQLVLLAMPVGQTRAVLERLAPHVDAQAVVSDAGSTKSDVIAAARDVLGPRIARFVPAHPIAGAEASGAEAARPDLYRGRRTVVTPLAENPADAVALVRDAWRACGAEVHEMDAAEHDRVFAVVSHLPHLLAFALVCDVLGHDDAERLFDYAAGGFRDFTRIASSHPEMWRDICLANRERLGVELDRYMDVLGSFRDHLRSGDGRALAAAFAAAREARNAWLARIEGGAAQ
jgi:prephenate dehydrogenase